MDSRMQPAIARRPNRTQPDQVGVPAAGSTFNGARFAGSMGAAPADRPAAPKRAASTGRQSSGGDVIRDGEEFRGAGYPPTRAPGPGVGPVDKRDNLRFGPLIRRYRLLLICSAAESAGQGVGGVPVEVVP